jgi:lipoprotein-anchoring transpeptidase ErfK/SrfK
MRLYSTIVAAVAVPMMTYCLPAAADAQSPDMVVSADASSMPLSEDQADTLKAGDFLWQPNVATSGSVNIVVDLDRQVAYVYRGGALIGLSTVSTGMDGHETPVGSFTILQKQVEHKSNLYHEAAMPYMERLTWDGVALHAGGVPGYRESHGCVHLPIAFAKLLYGVTNVGATVELRSTSAPSLPTDGVEDAQAATTVASNDAGGAPVTAPGVHLAGARNP